MSQTTRSPDRLASLALLAVMPACGAGLGWFAGR